MQTTRARTMVWWASFAGGLLTVMQPQREAVRNRHPTRWRMFSPGVLIPIVYLTSAGLCLFIRMKQVCGQLLASFVIVQVLFAGRDLLGSHVKVSLNITGEGWMKKRNGRILKLIQLILFSLMLARATLAGESNSYPEYQQKIQGINQRMYDWVTTSDFGTTRISSRYRRIRKHI